MSFAAMVRYVMRGLVYSGRFAATVVNDYGDGTVDIDPDDGKLRGQGLQRVPKRTGTPIGTSVVRPGSRCLFGFEDSDPRKPFIAAWQYERDAAIVSFDGGSPLARQGDHVKVMVVSPALPLTGMAGGIQDVPNPSPPPPTLPNDIPLNTPFTIVANNAVPVDGVIDDGNRPVLA